MKKRKENPRERAPASRPSISRYFRIFSLVIILAMGGFLGGMFIAGQYGALKERQERDTAQHYEKIRSLLRSETLRLIRAIEIAQTRGPSGRAETAREEILERVRSTETEGGGHLFVIGPAGLMLSHPDQSLTGKPAEEFRDTRGVSVGNELTILAKDADGGYFEYFRQDPGQSRPALRMAFVRSYLPWGWIIGAEVPIDGVREVVRDNQAALRSEMVSRLFLIAAVVSGLMAAAIAVSNALARRLRKETDLFASSFRAMASRHRNMDTAVFSFYETSLLAGYANGMNEKVGEKTRKLRQEIQDRRQAQEELLKLSQAVEQSPAIVVITDMNGVIEYINPKFTDTTGYMPSEAIGRKTSILRSGFQPDGFYREFWKSVKKGGSWKGEFHNRKKNGELYWESALVTGIRNARGRVTHYLKVADDISERKRLEQNMEYLAHHDPLTGLPNRLLFSDRVHHAIAHAHRHGRSFAVMILDLDNFKTVNDTLGHEAGDELLKMTVKRFARFLREEDTASRMGGDEFNILVNDVGLLDNLHAVAKRIVESFRDAFPLKGKRVFVTPSIGIALYPQDGTTLEDLVKNADIALYRVKNAGKNGYQLFGRDYPQVTSRVSENGKKT